MRLYIYTVTLFFISLNLSYGQQNRYDARIGIHAGIINYYGDLNSKFIAPNDQIRDFDFDFLSYGISVERNLTQSWAVKLQYNRGQFIANDRAINWDGSRDVHNSNYTRSLNAKTDIDDLGLKFTYYTDNGKLLSKNAFVSPYISFGVGLTHFKVFADLEDNNGNQYYYWGDNSIRNLPEGSPNATIIEQDGYFETNVTALETEKNYDTNVLNIPFGGGLKFRLAERFNLNLDYTLRYTFTDYLDDVSGEYREVYSSESQTFASNPTNTIADLRGNDEGNDWYAFLSVSLHYSFGKKERAFNSPVIFSSRMYQPAVLPPPIRQVDTISSLPVKALSGLRDSLSSVSESKQLPERSINKLDGRTTRRNRSENARFDDRRMLRMERRETIDSLSYLVEKQRLENELYNLKITSPDPKVKLKAKEDSLKIAEEYFAGAEMRSSTVDNDTLLSNRREELDKQIEALDRKLQKMVGADTSLNRSITTDSTGFVDTADVRFSEEVYNKKIDSLNNELENLRQRSLAKDQNTDSVQKSANEERILLEETMNDIQGQIQAVQMDTISADSLKLGSDSLAIKELQSRYEVIEQRLEQQKQRQQNYNDDLTGNEDLHNNVDQERIQYLEREMESLREERDKARNNNSTRRNTDVDSGERARIASLEREIDRLRNRSNATVNPVIIPAVENNEDPNKDFEDEMQQNEQMIDSLQQQIANLEARREIDTTENIPSIKNGNDNIDSQIDQMMQEIKDLRANLIAMDEDKAASRNNQQESLPEMPKAEVFFNIGSFILSNSDKTRIEELTKFIKKYQQSRVLLKGYTDPTGSPERNLMLSKKRAESVKQVLIGEGISENRITTEFFGADSETSGDLAYGRRVEILIR